MSKTGPIYSFVGSPDMSVKYTVVNPQEFVIKSKIKGVRERYMFLEGDYGYLSKCIPCLKILVAPDEDPTSVKGGNQCGLLDEEVTLPDYMVEASIALAKQSLTIFLQKQYDHSANKNESN
jgi:hypothetical protein